MLQLLTCCVAAVLLPLAAVQAGAVPLPSVFEKCHYGDGACITKNFQQGVNHFAKTGAPSIQLPPFSPINFTHIHMPRNESNPIKLDLTYGKGAIIGLDDMTILNVTGFDKDLKQNITVELTVPFMIFEGDYEVDGLIYDKPFSGKGFSKLILKQTYTHGVVVPRPVERDGKTYLEVVKVIARKYPEEAHFHFTGLYGGDEKKSQEMHDYLNANPVKIYMDIDPDLEDAKAFLFEGLFKSVFAAQPYADFFLED